MRIVKKYRGGQSIYSEEPLDDLSYDVEEEDYELPLTDEEKHRLTLAKYLYNSGSSYATLLFPEYSEFFEMGEPSFADKALKWADYALNPYFLVSDWLLEQSWVPDWIKTASPYVAAMGPAMGKNPAAKRGQSRASARDQLIIDNLLAFHEVPSREAGAGYMGKDGFVHYRGNVGRPYKSKSRVAEEAPLQTLTGLPVLQPTRTKRPTMGETPRTRGRISKATIETFWELKDPVILEKPTAKLIKDFLTSYRLKFKSYYAKEASLRARLKELCSIIDSPEANNIAKSDARVEKARIENLLGQLHSRMKVSLKKFRLSGYYDGLFEAK